MSCISSDLDKTPAKFQKDPGKIVGVGFTRYPVSIYFKPKKYLSSNW